MDIETNSTRTFQAPLKESRDLTRKLSESQIYRDYEKAYSEASGLPLAIRPIQSFQMSMHGKAKENPFCAIMAKTNKSCIACLEVQSELERSAQLKPRSLSCFAGLCDSMVPIRVGEKVIAFLQTGQVLLHKPTRERFSDIARRLLEWGSQVDLKALEEAYFQTKVLDEEQYRGFIRMLTTFAEHLALVGNSIAVQESKVEPVAIARARKYIERNYTRSLSLDEAAKAVNTSVRYFCKVFKQSTGITFIDYLTRLRIEKAKNLLVNPNRRVSEVAYEVGFESLTQFNRSFKRICGETPSQFRKGIA